MGAGMNFVPRIAGIAVVSLAMAGLASPVFAGGLMPGNGGPIILPLALPHSSLDAVTLTGSGFDSLGQKFGVQNGRLDFFALRPDDGGFKPLLRGGVGDGGLQLQLKW
jgi:hypothetical protein